MSRPLFKSSRQAHLAALTALSCTSLFNISHAFADEVGPYVGAGFVHTQFDHDWEFGPNASITHVDDDDQGYKILAGWRVVPWLAVEVSFADLGGASSNTEVICAAAVDFPCPTRLSADVRTAQLSALVLWPVGQFDLFAKAGIHRWEGTARIADDTTTIARVREDDIDPVFGLGAQYRYEHLALRLEYEHLDIGDSEAKAFSFGAMYRF